MLKEKLISFIGVVIFITLVIASFFIFSYIFIFVALIALILSAVSFIKTKLSKGSANQPTNNTQRDAHQGRTIDHDDN